MGEAQVKAMADKVRAAKFAEAADEMEVFAKQEGHHGKLMAEILARYPQEEKKGKGQKVYVCPVCGYEYEGISTEKAMTGSALSAASSKVRSKK